MDHLEYKIEMRGPLFQTKITFFQAVILQPDQSLIIPQENHNHLKIQRKFLLHYIFTYVLTFLKEYLPI